MSIFKVPKTKFTTSECRVVFPSFDMFNMAALIGNRLSMIASIPEEHDIVLRKMAEICAEQWSLSLLQWMYLVHENRNNLMLGYRVIIADVDAGKMEIGTRKEAFGSDA